MSQTSLSACVYQAILTRAATGAIFNVSGTILNVILGLPPLLVTAKIIALKHYLKVFGEEEDAHQRFITSEITSGNITVQLHVKELFKFLQWKIDKYPKDFNNLDRNIVSSLDLQASPQLSQKCCWYTKYIIDQYMEILWQESAQNPVSNGRVASVSKSVLRSSANTTWHL